jgi:hypothetical protein
MRGGCGGGFSCSCGRDGLGWHVIYVTVVVVMLLNLREARMEMRGCGDYGVGSRVRNRLGGAHGLCVCGRCGDKCIAACLWSWLWWV